MNNNWAWLFLFMNSPILVVPCFLIISAPTPLGTYILPPSESTSIITIEVILEGCPSANIFVKITMDYSYAITEPVHAGAATIYANSVFAGSHYVTATVLGHGIAITEEVTVGFNLIPSFLLAERPDPEALMPPPPVPTCGTAAPSGNLTYITYLDQHPTTSLSGQHIIWLHQIEYLVTVGGYRVLVVLLGEWEREGGYVGRLMKLNESDR